MYSIQQVADLLCVNHYMVRRLLRTGKMGYLQVGRLKRIPVDDYKRFVQDNYHKGNKDGLVGQAVRRKTKTQARG